VSEARAGGRGREGRVGTVINGKWQVDARIGSGGMATVYAATHRNGHRAALKMLHSTLSRDPSTRARFLREGYVANAVGHPGVVAVLDDGVAEDGSAFLVLELLEGETIDARRVRMGGKLPVDDALDLADQALDALAAAHEKGIIHRDVKPENVFLTNEGQVKLLDFGLARMKDQKTEATKTGVTIGTPEFMPPEQAMGRRDSVDARSDVWGLGATIYTSITGRFVHEDAQSIHEQLIASATRRCKPIRQFAPHVTPDVAQVIDRALELEMSDRWQSARDMQAAMHAARGERPTDFTADSMTIQTAAAAGPGSNPFSSQRGSGGGSGKPVSSDKTVQYTGGGGKLSDIEETVEDGRTVASPKKKGGHVATTVSPQMSPDDLPPFRKPLLTPSADHVTLNEAAHRQGGGAQNKFNKTVPSPGAIRILTEDDPRKGMPTGGEDAGTMMSAGMNVDKDEPTIGMPSPRNPPMSPQSFAASVQPARPEEVFDATVAAPPTPRLSAPGGGQGSPRAFRASAPPPPPQYEYGPPPQPQRASYADGHLSPYQLQHHQRQPHMTGPPPPMNFAPAYPQLQATTQNPSGQLPMIPGAQQPSRRSGSGRIIVMISLALIVVCMAMGAWVLYNGRVPNVPR